jgi:hypothetical protein
MGVAPTTRRLLVVVAVVVVAVPWFVVARTLVNAKPVATDVAAPRSIAWGGRVFSTKADLAAWLRSHGASYGVWAELHPNDRAILERTSTVGNGSSQSAEAGPGTATVSTTPSGTATPHASGATSATSASGNSVSWLTITLLALASIAMLAALLPSVVPVTGEDVRLTSTQRAYLFAAGFSVSVGVLVAGNLS